MNHYSPVAFGVMTLVIVSLMVGELPLSALLDGEATVARAIILDIRLPRIIAAAAVGAALGAAGAAMQGLLRNPLAEPGVLGISAMATLGATAVLYFGPGFAAPWTIGLGAMGGAALATLLLVRAAYRALGVETLILIGVALSSLAGALMALMLNFAPNPFSLSDLINWTLGSVANRSWGDLAFTLPLIAAGIALLMILRRRLPAFAFGDEGAHALGIALGPTRAAIIGGVGLAVGGSVALAGAVGFVGLVAPHLVRPLVAHDPAATVPASAWAGALLLLAADLGSRMAPIGGELKLGVVCALIGAPLFLWIVWSRRGNA